MEEIVECPNCSRLCTIRRCAQCAVEACQMCLWVFGDYYFCQDCAIELRLVA